MNLPHQNSVQRSTAAWRTVLGALLVVSACGSPSGPDGWALNEVQNVRSWVTPALEEELNSQGHFDRVWTCPSWTGSAVAVDAAEEMAEEFGRNYLGATYALPGTDLAGEELSEVHGHLISWMDVESGVRAPVCAEPIFMPIDGDVTQATLNHYGPYYLVPLYVGHDQVAMVAVAAMTGAFFREDGTIAGAEGNEFRWAGTVHDNRFGNPLSPEAAVMVAASTADALAESIPRLIRPGHDVTVTAAKWKVQLDRLVPWTIKSDGSTVESAIVYVGLYPSFTEPLPGEPLEVRVFVADEDQPVEGSVRLAYKDGSTTSQLWPFREGIDVNFREVMPRP